MYRILHVVPNLQRHGTQTFIMNVLKNINHDKVIFDFLVIGNDKEGFYKEIISYGGRIFYIPTRKEGFRSYHKNLDNFFKNHASEFFAIHYQSTTLSSIAPLSYARRHGINKRIVHINGAGCEELHNKVLHYINKFRLPGVANIFLSCSNEASKWGYAHTSMMKRAQIVQNGIDIKNFKFNLKKRNEIRSNLGIKDNEIVLLHAGAFNAIKNQKFLIDILGNLSIGENTIKLMMAGDGMMKESVRKYVIDRNLTDLVIFLDTREDIPDIMSASDIFIFPSLHEGFGLAAVEAQANGLPTIVSTGIPEEVKISDNFLRIDLKEGTSPWVKAIENIISKGVTHINKVDLDKYSIQNTVKNLLNLYLK